MIYIYNDVALFHERFGVPRLQFPGIPAPDRIALRRSLISEEVDETFRAVHLFDMVEVADGIADSIYVIAGTMVEFGILPEPGSLEFNLTTHMSPAWPSTNVVDTAKRKVIAELKLLSKGIMSSDIGMIKAGCCLSIRALASLGLDFAIPLIPVWNEVQRSNMSKLEKPEHDPTCDLPGSPPDNPKKCNCGAVLYREDGKIMKGSGYSPADIKGVLEKSGWVSPLAKFERDGNPNGDANGGTFFKL